MATHTYTSFAFVLGGLDVGEGSRSLALYTRELGLVYGVARSVREARSKLRYALQPYSLSEVSLVRGKDVWRVTGAREATGYYFALAHAPLKQEVAVRILALLRRLIRGEEPHGEIFTLIENGLSFLLSESLSDEEVALVECAVVIRLLYLLGYVGETSVAGELADLNFSRELLSRLHEKKRALVLEINRSLAATQL